MTDDPNVTPEPEPAEVPPSAEPTGPNAGEAWSEVVARMGELSEAVAAWARAAADNPENRRHAEDVKAGITEIASKAESAFSRATSTEFGQQVVSGAEEAGQAIGDTAKRVSEAAAPHVASAFAGLADVFGRAAHKVEEAAARQREPVAAQPDAAEPDAPATPADAPEPPASDE